MTTKDDSIASAGDGQVSVCEYLLLGIPGWELAPEIEYNGAVAFDQVASRLRAYHAAGGTTLVDSSGIASGRNADFIRSLRLATGIDIGVSTGFPSERFTPPHFFYDPAIARERDTDYLARLFAHEIQIGITGGGLIHRDLQARLVRTGYAEWPMTAMEESCHRAAARASKLTGVPVYTSGNRTNPAAAECLLSEGMDSSRIIVGHCDDGASIDIERDRRLAAAGVYVSYDHAGWEDEGLHPGAIGDPQRADLVAAMVEVGHVDRVLISASAVGYRLDGEKVSSHHFNHVAAALVPLLKDRGLTDEQLTIILHDNPRRALGPSA